MFEIKNNGNLVAAGNGVLVDRQLRITHFVNGGHAGMFAVGQIYQVFEDNFQLAPDFAYQGPDPVNNNIVIFQQLQPQQQP